MSALAKATAFVFQILLVVALCVALIEGIILSKILYSPPAEPGPDGSWGAEARSIRPQDLSTDCVPCSQQHETDGCLPSLCVERSPRLYCCVVRKLPR